MYYRCSFQSCPATMQVLVINGQRQTPVLKKGHSKHPKPSKKSLTLESRETMKNLVNMGQSRLQIQSRMSTDAIKEHGEISFSSVPEKRQIYNRKYYSKKKQLPSLSVFENLVRYPLVLHFSVTSQIIACTNRPCFNVLLATPGSMDRLVKYGKTFLIDGTFGVAEEIPSDFGSLTLLTLLVSMEGVYCPSVFILTNTVSGDNVSELTRQLRIFSANRWMPTTCFGDFEEAFPRGLTQVFKQISYLGDLFHFLQANRRKILELGGGKECARDLMDQLRVLYYSSSFQTFKSNLSIFLQHWQERYQPYVKYFRKTWDFQGLHDPSEWAGFTRFRTLEDQTIVDCYPSGDQALEGFHNRLKSHPDLKRKAIDHLIPLLEKELTQRDNF